MPSTVDEAVLETLREYAARYQSVVDTVRDIVFRADAEGRWKELNPAWETLLGYTVAESLGASVFDFVHPDDRETCRQKFDALAQGNDSCEMRLRLRPRDGGSRWMEARLYARRDPQGKFLEVFGVLEDIDERYRAGEELRYVTAHAHCLLWHATVTRSTAEADPYPYDWNIYMFDDAASSSFLPLAMNPGESYNDAWYRSRLPEDRERTDHIAANALESGQETYSQEFRCRRADGEVRWLFEQAYIERLSEGRWRLAGVCTDITEQKKLEAHLIADARKQQRIAENLQRSLLLKFPPDAFAGLEIATVYEPAWDEAQIGGDFFDTVRVDDCRVAVIVGDVTGKGLQAASHTAEIKFTLRAFLREDPDPARALFRLNSFLIGCQRWDIDRRFPLAALSLAVINAQTGETICASAGAEPPLLRRASDGAAVEIAARGLLLGADSHPEYDTATLTLHTGDALILITDGITEARTPASKTPRRRKNDAPEYPVFFGYDGLISAAQNAFADTAQTLEETGQAIIEAARAFAGGELADDACILLVRKR